MPFAAFAGEWAGDGRGVVAPAGRAQPHSTLCCPRWAREGGSAVARRLYEPTLPKAPALEQWARFSHRIYRSEQCRSLTMRVSGLPFSPRRGSKGGAFSGAQRSLLKSSELGTGSK